MAVIDDAVWEELQYRTLSSMERQEWRICACCWNLRTPPLEPQSAQVQIEGPLRSLRLWVAAPYHL
jgi:hypothetical protein